MKSFTSLIKLYETNKVVYKYYTSFRDKTKRLHTNKEIDEFLKFRPIQAEINDFEEYLTDFWQTFIDKFEGMKEYVDSHEADAAAKFRNRENGGLLYFRPIALPELVISVLETCFRTEMQLAESMAAYSKLEMYVSKEPWIKVLWDSERHTMIMSNKTLVHLLLIHMYDKSILKKPEKESLKRRYAKILNVEVDEVEVKLNELCRKK